MAHGVKFTLCCTIFVHKIKCTAFVHKIKCTEFGLFIKTFMVLATIACFFVIHYNRAFSHYNMTGFKNRWLITFADICLNNLRSHFQCITIFFSPRKSHLRWLYCLRKSLCELVHYS